jgi:RNA polymerase-binding transcription factor DksA
VERDRAADDLYAPGVAPDDADLLDQIASDLDGVEEALGRLDDGSFFVCERCGEDLSDDFLARAPLSRRCDACSTI